jgi:hypothetical protein
VDRKPEDVLSKQELDILRNRLAKLSGPHVEDFYRQTHQECCLHGGKIPSPRVVQQFVTAWKLLWRWRSR